ncbi:hypothetical protein ACOMHN_031235 [Nucella lapillus]
MMSGVGREGEWRGRGGDEKGRGGRARVTGVVSDKVLWGLWPGESLAWRVTGVVSDKVLWGLWPGEDPMTVGQF